MRIWRRLYFIILAGVGGLILVVALLYTLPRLETPTPTPTSLVAAFFPPTPVPTPTRDPRDPVVAVVNDDSITLAEWQYSVALDRAMNALAKQPSTSPEATLDRLINERLVLRAAQAEQPPLAATEAQAQARLDLLEKTWGIDDDALDQALSSTGLTRPVFLAEIQRLLVIEAYIKQISATQDASQWLAMQRASARVSLYVDLASTSSPAPTQVSALPSPQPVAPLPSPTVASTTSLPAGPLEGQLAPDFTLTALDGKVFKLSALRGQPVVINFWATWCPICRGELPDLLTAYAAYRDKGVALLGVDVREEAATLQPFVAQNALTFPVLLDTDGAVADLYQVRGIPTTVILDAGGVVRVRHLGPLAPEKFAEYVEPLLASSAAPTPAAASAPAAKTAPDFSLARESGATVRLSDYRNKDSVVLVFYRGQT